MADEIDIDRLHTHWWTDRFLPPPGEVIKTVCLPEPRLRKSGLKQPDPNEVAHRFRSEVHRTDIEGSRVSCATVFDLQQEGGKRRGTGSSSAISLKCLCVVFHTTLGLWRTSRFTCSDTLAQPTAQRMRPSNKNATSRRPRKSLKRAWVRTSFGRFTMHTPLVEEMLDTPSTPSVLMPSPSSPRCARANARRLCVHVSEIRSLTTGGALRRASWPSSWSRRGVCAKDSADIGS